MKRIGQIVVLSFVFTTVVACQGSGSGGGRGATDIAMDSSMQGRFVADGASQDTTNGTFSADPTQQVNCTTDMISRFDSRLKVGTKIVGFAAGIIPAEGSFSYTQSRTLLEVASEKIKYVTEYANVMTPNLNFAAYFQNYTF